MTENHGNENDPKPEIIKTSKAGDAPTTYQMPLYDHMPSDNARKCRYELCQAHYAALEAISHIDTHEHMKSELRNLFTIALRMSLLANDGHISPVELRSW